MRNALASIATLAILLTSLTASAKPRRHRAHRVDSTWMTTCIQERTGPDGGVSKSEARAICKAEQPEDEVSAAKAQLALAKLNAKVAKAKAKAAAAIEKCEQAVVDRCVETAPADGSVSCEDEPLRAEFALACH